MVKRVLEIQDNKVFSQANCMNTFLTVEHNWLGTFHSEVLLPDSCIRTHSDGTKYAKFFTKHGVSETKMLALITVSILLCLLVYIHNKSTNPYYLDWFRIFVYYIIATHSIIFLLLVSPNTPGFSRFICVGVLIHNTAELFVIKVIWFGKKYGGSLILSIFSIIYMWFITTLIILLPLDYLFLVAMLQGATFDYTLVYSFICIYYRFKDLDYKWNKNTYLIGLVGSVLHITTIQPMFFGFSLGRDDLYGVTTLFVFPTMLFYTIFSSRELGRISFDGPSFTEKIKFVIKTNKKDPLMMKSSVSPKRLKNLSQESPKKISIPINEVEESQDSENSSDEQLLFNNKPFKQDKMEQNILSIASNASRHNRNEDSRFSDIKDINIEVSHELQYLGALSYFYNSKTKFRFYQVCEKRYRLFWFIFLAAFGSALVNTMVVWYTPCHVKSHCQY